MRRVDLFSFILTVNFSALAVAEAAPPQQADECPVLAGTYICKNADEQENTIHIQQEKIETVTIYTIIDENGETHLPADNADYRYSGQDQRGVTGFARHYCQDQTFHIQVTGRREHDQSVTEWDLTQSLSLDSDKNLSHQVSGFYATDGAKKPVDSESLCLRESNN